jgi:flagellar basal body P-ring formation protein FlgA
MNPLLASLVPLAVLTTAAMPASAERLCEAALADVQRFAQSQGWSAETRCRAPVGRPLPAGALLQAEPWPLVSTLRSGTLAWPVRVQIGNSMPYVQRVPLTVGWVAPAWVSTRELAAGAVLQPGDLELQSLRWPDGMLLRRADPATVPDGRTRRSLRRGEIVTDEALLLTHALVRGDRVTAVLAGGAVEVRLPAELIADARIGERARVQAAGRRVPLEGRLIDAQTFKVDSE